MAGPYHLNTTGTGVGGTTWITAFTTWAAAVGAMAAGDVLYVDSAFNSSAAGLTLAFPGTPASPNQILSGTPAGGSGLTALAAGAQALSSTTTYTITGSFYAYGITWADSVVASFVLTFANATTNVQVHDTCTFSATGAGGSTTYSFGNTGASIGTFVQLVNCSFKFSAAGQLLAVNGNMEMLGGNLISGGTSPTNFIDPGNGARACKLVSTGFDATNFAAGFNLCAALATAGISVLFSDLKLPASFSGLLQAGTVKAGCRSEFYAFNNSTSTGRFNITDYSGSAAENTTVYLTGSTTDGVNLSDKFTSTANIAFPGAFRGRWYYTYNSATGSSKTATIQCARDGSATQYKDNEVWIEVEYFGSSATPLGSFANDRMADVLATPASQTAGSGTWTGLGGTNCKMDLAATFTPQLAGYVRARVCVAVPSISDLYVDPVVTIT